MSIEDSYVLKDRAYYTPSIEQVGKERVLRLPEDPEPKLREGRALSVKNETETEVVVRLRNEKGEQIVEPAHLAPGDWESVHATNKIGNYDVELEFGKKTETFGWKVNWSYGSPKLTVRKDGYDLEQAVADIPVCNFEY
ncbi:hypothetical protein [Haladaptatus cibarius]|uniref:hypothetical protein n=1 Tax=Haladaptatus cibarius TaxID=453847 RepID=UPI00067973ED|nr:hypothetical protein [Haladaptatus cibarius]